MNTLRQIIGKIRLQLQGKNKVVGWNMTSEEAVMFFKGQGKTVLTFFGYMLGYENETEMFRIVREELSKYSPETALVNDGVTKWGLGEIYPLAKSLGFTTTGIVSKNILDDCQTSVHLLTTSVLWTMPNGAENYQIQRNSPPHPKPWWTAAMCSLPLAGMRSPATNCWQRKNWESPFTIILPR